MDSCILNVIIKKEVNIERVLLEVIDGLNLKLSTVFNIGSILYITSNCISLPYLCGSKGIIGVLCYCVLYICNCCKICQKLKNLKDRARNV